MQAIEAVVSDAASPTRADDAAERPLADSTDDEDVLVEEGVWFCTALPPP